MCVCDVYGVCRGLKLASIHNGRHWTETLLRSPNVLPVSWDWHPLRPYLFIFSNVWKHYAKERVAQIRCSSCCSIISVGLCLVQQVLHISIIPHVWSGKACLQTPVMMHKCGFLEKNPWHWDGRSEILFRSRPCVVERKDRRGSSSTLSSLRPLLRILLGLSKYWQLHSHSLWLGLSSLSSDSQTQPKIETPQHGAAYKCA